MKLPRRKLLHLAAGALALPAISRIASALDYPTRPVRWIVGFPPGGPNDITARIVAEFLSERLHQQFAVENRPGAAGNVATEQVARAQPDGYTVMELATVNAINASLYQNLNYDFVRDIALVAGFSQGPAVMEVNPKVPAATLPEFIAYAKANPGKINLGSAGIGTPQHVIGELFKMLTGTDMVHVPYHGSAPELTDLIAGQVQVVFEPIQSTLGYIKSGMLRPRVQRRCRICRRLANSYRGSRRAPGRGSVLRKARRSRSLRCSTPRSMPFLPIRSSRHGLPTSVSYQCP
jgi:tripartite-type tricarboxylate transporter receptor subunit TctC